MKRPLILALSILAIFVVFKLFFLEQQEDLQSEKITFPNTREIVEEVGDEVSSKSLIITQPKTNSENETPEPQDASSPPTASAPKAEALTSDTKLSRPKSPKGHLVLPYSIDEGLIIVQGDIVVGKPADDNFGDQGWVEVPKMRPWPSPIIPYHIQADFQNPERIHEALQFFSSTPIRFVPLHTAAGNPPKDALVFQNATGVCKSYVGRIGGLQPIWINAQCGPPEVAHEILHALGFVHEQNRTDRDRSIQVLFENIDNQFRTNFEILPQDFMLLSGLAAFDFESVMIYPDSLFSKTSSPTMKPIAENQQISPTKGLSPKDIERLNYFFQPR